MERVVVINWVVICVSILLFEFISSVSQHDFHHRHLGNEGTTHGGHIKEPNVWPNPKLGRKKRNSSNNDLYENIQKEGLAVLILDALRDAPWSNANEGKRHVVNFTPRLGRESGEEVINGVRSDENQWSSDDSAMSEEFLYQRSPPFAPRLGRHLSYLPRMGKENDRMSFS